MTADGDRSDPGDLPRSGSRAAAPPRAHRGWLPPARSVWPQRSCRSSRHRRRVRREFDLRDYREEAEFVGYTLLVDGSPVLLAPLMTVEGVARVVQLARS